MQTRVWMDPKMVDRQSPWLTRQALISHVEPTLLSCAQPSSSSSQIQWKASKKTHVYRYI